MDSLRKQSNNKKLPVRVWLANGVRDTLRANSAHSFSDHGLCPSLYLFQGKEKRDLFYLKTRLQWLLLNRQKRVDNAKAVLVNINSGISHMSGCSRIIRY